jgi:phage tail-like protein
MPLDPFEAHSQHRFTVSVEGLAVAAFIEFRLPSLEIETEEIKEGGQNAFVHRLPVRAKVGSISLKQGVTKDMYLLNWYLQVLRGDVSGATRQVTVSMYETDMDVMFTWNFRNAYPTRWVGPTLKAGDSSIAIEEIEFVHHGFEVR